MNRGHLFAYGTAILMLCAANATWGSSRNDRDSAFILEPSIGPKAFAVGFILMRKDYSFGFDLVLTYDLYKYAPEGESADPSFYWLRKTEDNEYYAGAFGLNFGFTSSKWHGFEPVVGLGCLLKKRTQQYVSSATGWSWHTDQAPNPELWWAVDLRWECPDKAYWPEYFVISTNAIEPVSIGIGIELMHY
jgi:hypothetical protein